ncbi:MAG: hypothetical protein IM526_02895 [Microcystis sp. M38BS1]|jgi:hypothetical protein|nr:hypothetical protein [Microcystis sp. M38BS1]MCA6582610.1 hypothetical protein [Pseudanabaena sp. M34BS1SP1A06MG]
MLYRNKEGQLISRARAILLLLNELGTVVEPSYIDDDTLALYGFLAAPEEIAPQQTSVSKEVRKEALANVDWVSGAKHLTKATKDAVEAWRSVVRDCPDCAALPPLPKLVATKTKITSPLNEVELDAIKNYVTEDDGWLLFLQTWKDLQFPDSKNIVANLLIAYTKVKLDEIIGSI